MPYTFNTIADSLAISSVIEATGSLRRIANSLDEISRILKAMNSKETHHENKDEYENKDECGNPHSGEAI